MERRLPESRSVGKRIRPLCKEKKSCQFYRTEKWAQKEKDVVFDDVGRQKAETKRTRSGEYEKEGVQEAETEKKKIEFKDEKITMVSGYVKTENF